MAEKDQYYSDFSKRKSFNNIPCRAGEVLAPVVVDSDYKEYLKTLGLDWNNIETWHDKYGRTVPVAFIQIKEDEMESSMSYFRAHTIRYLKQYQKTEWDEFSSIEGMLEAAEDDDRKGYDPTGTTENEDNAFLKMALEDLIADLNKQDPTFGRIIKLLAEGNTKGEVLDQIDLGREKTQAYAYIKKVQTIAKEIWYKNS
jgi:hypothetical protein